MGHPFEMGPEITVKSCYELAKAKNRVAHLACRFEPVQKP